MRAGIRASASSSGPWKRRSSGRSSTGIRCRAGRTDASRCSGTRATRCFRSWRRARRRPSRTAPPSPPVWGGWTPKTTWRRPFGATRSLASRARRACRRCLARTRCAFTSPTARPRRRGTRSWPQAGTARSMRSAGSTATTRSRPTRIFSGNADLAGQGSMSETEGADLGAEALDACELDVLVAANEVREGGELDRALVAGLVETRQRSLDQGAILADQRSLDTADLRVAERIESAAAEPAERDQRAERGLDPPADGDLPLEAEGAQDRRMEQVAERHAVRILRAERSRHIALEVKPRHLVLVLVGHELEQGARHGLGEAGLPGHRSLLLDCHASDERDVRVRVRR